jgi:hypothetical protein
MDCNLSKHIGTLKAEALLADKSPLTAAKLRGMVISVIGSYSNVLQAVIPTLMRIIDESSVSSGKSIPPNMLSVATRISALSQTSPGSLGLGLKQLSDIDVRTSTVCNLANAFLPGPSGSSTAQLTYEDIGDACLSLCWTVEAGSTPACRSNEAIQIWE